MPDAVEVLLVEDEPADAELTLRALRKENVANEIVHIADGEQALDFLGLYWMIVNEPPPPPRSAAARG